MIEFRKKTQVVAGEGHNILFSLSSFGCFGFPPDLDLRLALIPLAVSLLFPDNP